MMLLSRPNAKSINEIQTIYYNTFKAEQVIISQISSHILKNKIIILHLYNQNHYISRVIYFKLI